MHTYGIAARIAVFEFRQSVGGELDRSRYPVTEFSGARALFYTLPPRGQLVGSARTRRAEKQLASVGESDIPAVCPS